jgi:hypothetical protein
MSTLRNTVNSQLPVVKWEKQHGHLKTIDNKKLEIPSIYTADNLENHSLLCYNLLNLHFPCSFPNVL